MFGAVSISGALPKAGEPHSPKSEIMEEDCEKNFVQELIVYYYDKYYGNHHKLVNPKNPFHIHKEGFMDYNIDKDFGNCVDSFILVEVDKIKSKKKERYY